MNEFFVTIAVDLLVTAKDAGTAKYDALRLDLLDHPDIKVLSASVTDCTKNRKDGA